MKKLVLCTLALCCLAGHTRAQAQPQPPPQQPQPGRAQGAQAQAGAASQPAAPAAAPKVRLEPAKVITDELFARGLKDLGGRDFRLSEYRGRVFVINVWATWCGPCRLEIPGLNGARRDFAVRGVEFLGLTTEDPARDAAQVRAFAREFEMKYRVGWLDKETGLALLGDRYVIPQTFVVGTDGHVVLHVRGYNERVSQMVRAGIERALEAPPAAGQPAAEAAKPAAPEAAKPAAATSPGVTRATPDAPQPAATGGPRPPVL
jgi:thiol-disulfide isomerase/thioredoxin